MAPKIEKVSLRDIMALQKDIEQKINSVDDKLNKVIVEMERWKIKAIIISGIVALIVSLGVRLTSLLPDLIKHF